MLLRISRGDRCNQGEHELLEGMVFQDSNGNFLKTVVISGIRGFIAKALKNRFELEHYRVIGTDRADSARIQDLLHLVQPELIIHAAAELFDTTRMFESNVVLTYNILEFCREQSPSCRIILVGSSSEYGRKETATKESDSLEPETIYEGTKAAAAMLARAYSYTYRFQAAIIRPYTIYGPGEKPQRFLQQLLLLPNKIRLCPTPAHDFVYIDDFVEAVFAVLKRQAKLFDVVNVGSGIQTTNLEVVKAFEKVFGHKYEIEEILPLKPNDAMVWVCDPCYLLNEYGFKVSTSLEEGICLMKATKNNTLR